MINEHGFMVCFPYRKYHSIACMASGNSIGRKSCYGRHKHSHGIVWHRETILCGCICRAMNIHYREPAYHEAKPGKSSS